MLLLVDQIFSQVRREKIVFFDEMLYNGTTMLVLPDSKQVRRQQLVLLRFIKEEAVQVLRMVMSLL
jgi:hypothetical protein